MKYNLLKRIVNNRYYKLLDAVANPVLAILVLMWLVSGVMAIKDLQLELNATKLELHSTQMRQAEIMAKVIYATEEARLEREKVRQSWEDLQAASEVLEVERASTDCDRVFDPLL